MDLKLNNLKLIISSLKNSTQVLINVIWMLIAPTHAKHHYPTREDNHLVCDSHIDASYMIAFFFPILLIVVCTIYAVLTRKIPEAFNESKHIGFTMYTTCVIWLAFVPLYFATANHVPLRITSMSVTISLSASVTMTCLFTPKVGEWEFLRENLKYLGKFQLLIFKRFQNFNFEFCKFLSKNR